MSDSDFPVRADQLPVHLRGQQWPLVAAPAQGFAVLRLATETWSPERVVRRRAFPNAFLALVHAGRATLATPTSSCDIAAGHAVAMHGRCDVIITIHEPLALRIAVAGGSDAHRLVAAHGGATPGAWPLAHPEPFERIWEGMCALAQEGGPLLQESLQDCFRVLVRLLHAGRRAAPRHGRTQAVVLAMRLIDADPLAAWSVAVLARRCGVDRSYLAREFRQFHGCAPSVYLARVRLAQGAALLAGGASVAQAAAQCGYSDAFAFSKAFRRHYRVPPSQWRG